MLLHRTFCIGLVCIALSACHRIDLSTLPFYDDIYVKEAAPIDKVRRTPIENPNGRPAASRGAIPDASPYPELVTPGRAPSPQPSIPGQRQSPVATQPPARPVQPQPSPQPGLPPTPQPPAPQGYQPPPPPTGWQTQPGQQGNEEIGGSGW